MPAWRFYPVRVPRTRRLSPSFLRVTFTGPDLDRLADNGYDQRIKLVLPLPDGGAAELPDGPDWYPQWRALPEDRRAPIRTYTVRAVRPPARGRPRPGPARRRRPGRPVGAARPPR